MATALRQVVHIGQRKTATTWLQTIMGRAADAQGFTFQRGGVGIWRRNNAAFGDDVNFADLTERLTRVRDQDVFISVEGLISYEHARMAEAIFAGLPDARILVTTRGPAGYLRSSYANAVRGGAVQEPARFARAVTGKHMMRTHDLVGVEEAYGKERTRFIPYELIRDDAVAFLNEVGAWFGNDPVPFMPESGRNVSPPPYFLELVRRVNARLAEAGSDVWDTVEWQQLLDMAFRSVGHAGELWPEFEARLTKLEVTWTMPEIPSDAWPRLREMAAPLRSSPLHRPYLDCYGLDDAG